MKTFRRFLQLLLIISLLSAFWLPASANSEQTPTYPTFLRGPFPLSSSAQVTASDATSAALNFLSERKETFGIRDVNSELQSVADEVDGLGISHVTLQQYYQGVPVYNALMNVHSDRIANQVLAVGNGFVANISLSTVEPAVSAESVTASALKLLAGRQRGESELMVYPGSGSDRSAVNARLAWMVEVLSPDARKLFVFDASDGVLIDVIDRLYEGSRLETYDAKHTQTLPGTLVREDDQPSTGNVDVDNAHEFANATVKYYLNTHSRNSYDGNGAVVKSTANYGTNYQNAFWNGEQMVYGDGFAVIDVVGHELTHAVTERSANLEYVWQSGALNESFSDIFGAMIDRDDWLMGEDLADVIGQDAVRDLEDPERFGQPANTDDWVSTCDDNEGVHTNSGIFNKAYYNIATAISKETAEKIFYRALTEYLQPTSSFDDARSAVLQATSDIAAGNTKFVEQGFADVGMTEGWAPEPNSCTCVVAASVRQADSETTQSVLYDVRDQVLSASANGQHYTDLYYSTTAEISAILLARPDLRSHTASLIATFKPGLKALVNGNGSDIVTGRMVQDVRDYLQELQAAARDAGNDELVTTLENEEARIDWSILPGMTFEEAQAYFDSLGGLFSVFLPTINR